MNLNNHEIEYDLKVSKRARRMKLAIYGDGSFVVTKPYNISDDKLFGFVRLKAEWILARLGTLAGRQRLSMSETRKQYLKYRERARVTVYRELHMVNQYYGFKYNRISIRNQRTVWGSCSSKKNLNFSYRILFLPAELVRYVVTHELCHLKEMNHSIRFWSLVAETVPNYKILRRQLKKQSH